MPQRTCEPPIATKKSLSLYVDLVGISQLLASFLR
jgi:hypothetical protein